jgi:hypothetical protein
LVGSAVVATFCGFFAHGLFSSGGLLYLLFVPFALVGLVSFLFFLQAVWMLIVGGRWEIYVTSDRVTWTSPPVGSDASFDFRLDQIARLERRRKIKSNGRLDKIKHYVVPLEGQPIRLSRHSKIDLAEFVEALGEAGVPIEDVDVVKGTS